MPSDEQNLAPAQSPSLTELLTLVNSLKHQLDTQKTELTQQISQLQTELAQVRQQPASTTAPVASAPQSPTTSRRRMLGKVFTSFAGAAALAAGGAALTAAPAAQADAFNFNGTDNSATISTVITEPSSTNGAFPIFTFVNNNTAAANADPNNPAVQPIGIYANSNNYAGIYSVGGGNASGVIGVSGAAAAASTFNANNFGGVVGSSTSNGGVIGISTTGYGVTGLSAASYGVAGVTQTATGAVFAVDSATSFYQSAALRLVPRQPLAGEAGLGAPYGTTYNHRQGEFHLDKFARVYVCNAAYLGGTGSNEPAVAKPRLPTFPNGPISNAGASWQLLAPMAVRVTSPSTAFAATDATRDQALHSVGEIWLDRLTGKMYVCTVAGANDLNTVNADLQSKLGISTLPTFLPVATGSGFNFYQNLSLYKIRILAEGFDAGTTPLSYGQIRTYNIPQVINSYPIPANGKLRLPQPPTGFSAIFGTLTIYAPNFAQSGAFTTGQYIQSSPGTSADTLVLAASKGQEKVSNFVVLPVDSSGQLSFRPQNSNIVGDFMYITFDMFGYIF